MKINRIIILASLILTLILLLSACGGNRLTLENYNKIDCVQNVYDRELDAYITKDGMTFIQVRLILGKPTSYDVIDEESKIVTYVWGTEEIFIKVTFNDGIAVEKTKSGIK